ncbi:PREDICTED: olfactory receptor 5W2-like [Capra hircus]|uniref:olfactory receptor 5W2-like n=1 Tax=Capra hircus TaxID=9925 RepID=UPI0008471914|nr:PREDICTED: olfactory receptor 5W2-like [Capra hircus]
MLLIKGILTENIVRKLKSKTNNASVDWQFTSELRRTDRRNCSSMTDFIFLGITDNAVNKVILFTIFLFVYLITLLANLGIITLIRMDPQLHTPMYFFLSCLSFSGLSIYTTVGPKMLVDLFDKNKLIPFYGCALQLLVLYCTFMDRECLLIAVMAYDWYKAVSSPLLYAVSMSSRVCSLLIAGVYLVGIADALIHMTLAFHLCFCGSNEINYFFCDVAPLLLLSCPDTQVNELLIFTAFGFIELSTISGVLVSYIILSVLKIHSAKGGLKAFSTCTSHLTSMAIFKGIMVFMYFRPSSSYSLDEDKMTSLFHTLVVPMLNLLIYSLRNKDVKQTLKKSKNKWFKKFIFCICAHMYSHTYVVTDDLLKLNGYDTSMHHQNKTKRRSCQKTWVIWTN